MLRVEILFFREIKSILIIPVILGFLLVAIAPHAVGSGSEADVKHDDRNFGPAVSEGALKQLGVTQIGIASWYGPGFHGSRTASGIRYDMFAMTAAHRTLPFGTRVRVTRFDNGRSVTVRITDRGPFVRGRVIDLSRAAAQKIGLIDSGFARVKIERL